MNRPDIVLTRFSTDQCLVKKTIELVISLLTKQEVEQPIIRLSRRLPRQSQTRVSNPVPSDTGGGGGTGFRSDCRGYASIYPIRFYPRPRSRWLISARYIGCTMFIDSFLTRLSLSAVVVNLFYTGFNSIVSPPYLVIQ